jgi:spore coat protein CotF
MAPETPRHATPSPTAPPRNLATRFDLAADDNDPKEGLPELQASAQRVYIKLSQDARNVITSQRPTAFRDTTRSFALTMYTLSNRVSSKKECEKPFDDAPLSDPYIPNHLRFKTRLTPSDDLKDNAEAQEIVSDYTIEMKTFQQTLAKKHHELAKLETKMAKAKRLQGFAEGLYTIFLERIQNQVYDKNRASNLTRNSTDDELAAVGVIRFIYKTGLGASYFREYLDSNLLETALTVTKHVTNDTDRQRRIKDMSAIESLRPENAGDDYTPATTLTPEEIAVLQEVTRAMEQNNWFRTITLDSQKLANDKRQERLENEKILARRKAAKTDTATELTAAALTTETPVNRETLETLITEVVDKTRRDEIRKAKKAKRKNSLGGRDSPAATKPKKQRGQSTKGGSNKDFRNQQGKRNKNQKKNGGTKQKPPPATKKNGRGKAKRSRPGQRHNEKPNDSARKRHKKR